MLDRRRSPRVAATDRPSVDLGDRPGHHPAAAVLAKLRVPCPELCARMLKDSLHLSEGQADAPSRFRPSEAMFDEPNELVLVRLQQLFRDLQKIAQLLPLRDEQFELGVNTDVFDGCEVHHGEGPAP
jgi:hypothetical protein